MVDVERCENIMYEFSLYISFKVSYIGIQSMKKKISFEYSSNMNCINKLMYLNIITYIMCIKNAKNRISKFLYSLFVPTFRSIINTIHRPLIQSQRKFIPT